MTSPNNNNKASSVSEVLARFSTQDSGSSDKGGVSSKGTSSESFYVPMGQMAFIVGELQKMLKFSVDQTEILSENQKQAALSYMGGSTDANGVVTVDYTKGVIYCMQQAQIDAGNDAAEGLRQQSKGQWASMGMGLGGLAVMGGMAGKDSFDARGPQGEKTSLVTFKDQLESDPGANGIQGSFSAPETDPEVTAQIERWNEGKDCTYDARDPVKVAAMNRLKSSKLDADTEALKAIKKTLDDQIKAHSDTLEKIGSHTSVRNQWINQGSQAGVNGGQAYFSMQQAKAREQEGKDSAAASVLTQVQQQMSANLDKTREQADAARQEAIQTANLIAQVQNVRV